MHRAGSLALIGRRCLKDGVARNGDARRGLTTGSKAGGSTAQYAKIATGLAISGSTVTGIAYACGVIDTPWRSKESPVQNVEPANSFLPVPSESPWSQRTQFR